MSPSARPPGVAFHDWTTSGSNAHARTVISQLILKSQWPLLERLALVFFFMTRLRKCSDFTEWIGEVPS
jgi:hypothetical protein